MMTLPRYHCRRAWLRSFWTVQSALAGVVCGLAAQLAGGPGVPIGLAAALGLALPGWLRPHATAGAYRAWNRLAARIAAAARLYVSRVCLLAFFPIVGLLGSSMQMQPAGAQVSGWTGRPRPRTFSFRAAADLPEQAREDPGWLRGYLAWARHGDRLWSLALLPFLVVLAVVEEDVATDLPDHDVYTLF